ncbi:MAG: carboxymuconolactone decarboxylase family protein [Thermoanaerobaculia bacterium]
MSKSFTIHTSESAPEQSRGQLQQVAKSFGMIPNLAGVLAEAPAALEAYFTLGRLVDETSFTPVERQVVLLSVSAENGCEYCVAAHSAIAGMQKVPGDVVQAIRDGHAIADPKLEALRRLTTAVVAKRGRLDEDDLARFHAAGYGNRQLLEVIVGVGMKTISNYVNHVAETPLDAPFAKLAWTRPVPAACSC